MKRKCTTAILGLILITILFSTGAFAIQISSEVSPLAEAGGTTNKLILSENSAISFASLSCGQLGSKKGYAQSNLRCERKGCASGYISLGKTYDCKVCCARKNTATSNAAVKKYVASNPQMRYTSKTCGQFGASKKIAQSRLRCEQLFNCKKGYFPLGSTRDCAMCCAKYIPGVYP